MFTSIYDYRDFYAKPSGKVIQRILSDKILECWPECNGLSFLGYGYAAPYISLYDDKTAQAMLTMPAALGAHHWPEHEPGRVCLAEDSELPFETNSIDRILIVHGLERTEIVASALGEIWRVLKSNGRIIMIVPNRLGLWSKAEWTPFGHGRPYSEMQLTSMLKEALFVPEKRSESLFMPPLKSRLVMKSARFFEAFGQYVYPILGGVLVIEASKQLYAPSSGTKAPARLVVRSRAAAMEN